jgi:hypothetical protein
MKKIISFLILSISYFLSIVPVQAADINSFAQCAIVPLASFNLNGSSTAVGLTSNANSRVHWLYYDEDGSLMDSGSFAVTPNVLTGFTLSTEVPPALADLDGFLLFCADQNNDGAINSADGATLAANAFRVKTETDDVIYVPTIPVNENDLQVGNRTISNWTDSPVVSLPVGGGPGNNLHLQYFVNGVAGDGERTIIYLFTTTAPPVTIDVTVSGPDSNTTTTTLTLANSSLNVINLEDVAIFTDPDFVGSGNILWPINGGGSVFAFSVAESSVFSAAQTLMANIDASPNGGNISGWDLVVDSIVPATTTPVTNQRFSITTTVRNIGDKASVPTTLQLFLSTDSTVDDTDSPLLASPSSIGILQPAEITTRSREVNAPGSSGSYWIGACIADQTSEAATDNNCSTVVQITVTDNSIP